MSPLNNFYPDNTAAGLWRHEGSVMNELIAALVCLALMLLVAWLTKRLGIVVKPGG